jgi:tetratricopeptide (TPR) repeat protein
LEAAMRGIKTVGLLLSFAAAFSFLAPAPAKSQGASDSQYYAAGNQYYAARNYAQAAQYYYAAVKINPNNAAAYQGLGNCYYALGRKSDALTFYQRASALQPGNAQLAQFVQNLQAQLGGGGAVAPGVGTAPASPASSYLAYGNAYLQRKQYAAALKYFQAAIQQDPSNYKGYYYGGYTYVAAGDNKDGALYFEVAAAKSGNASIQAYADRVKSSLSADDQQWVDDQVSKFTGMSMASTGGKGKGNDVTVGFHLMGGMEYIFADPSQIKQYVTAAQSVSLNGVTPNIVALPELEPYIQLGQNFEINLAIGYFPVGNLSYTTFDYNPAPPYPTPGLPDVWKYTFNTSIITTDLGIKLLFGDDKSKGYLGLSAGISPISTTFSKVQYDSTGTNVLGTDASTGNYSALAFNGQAILGADFSLGKGIAFGPYIGYRYLNATNFQSGGNTLQIDTKTGAVGIPGSKTAAGYSNLPLGDPTTALSLDFSGLEGGLNITFSF